VGKKTKLNKSQVELLVQNVLEKTLNDTVMELEEWIESKVAKRTGKLRKDLKLELSSSFIKNMVLKLKLGTHITYAEFVNAMTTSTVRHVDEVGYAYYGGKSGKLILNDPRAIGSFFTKMVQYAKERLEINFAKAKAMYLGTAGKAGRMISSKFKWK